MIRYLITTMERRNYYLTTRTIMAAVALAITLNAYSLDFVYGNLFYRHSGNDATCSVIAGRAKYIGDIVIPAFVTLNNKRLMVTSIAPDAFAGCEHLLSVQLPTTATSIGNDAFKGCRRLLSVSLPESLLTVGARAFVGCTSLNSITIPNEKTQISKDAFDRHTKLVFGTGNTARSTKQNPKDQVLLEESPL